MNTPVLQQWVWELPWKMQTVLIQGLRAPDTHYCDGIKLLCRWMRAVVLSNADKNHTFMCSQKELPAWDKLDHEINYCSFHQLTHFLYAMEIIAYKHLDTEIKKTAWDYYAGLTRHVMHFEVESEEDLDTRLKDQEEVPQMDELIEELVLPIVEKHIEDNRQKVRNKIREKFGKPKPPAQCPPRHFDNYRD